MFWSNSHRGNSENAGVLTEGIKTKLSWTNYRANLPPKPTTTKSLCCSEFSCGLVVASVVNEWVSKCVWHRTAWKFPQRQTERNVTFTGVMMLNAKWVLDKAVVFKFKFRLTFQPLKKKVEFIVVSLRRRVWHIPKEHGCIKNLMLFF